MRIVGGEWAGRHLTSPGKRVRPTRESVRVAWMEALASDLKKARIVDLFAGSGALGLEALSRGAASVDFVENGPASLHSLKANVAALRATKRTRIFKRDAIQWVQRLEEGRYDLAFVDTPYGSRKLDRIIQSWGATPWAKRLCVEHLAEQKLPRAGLARQGRVLVEGETRITVFEHSA